MNKIILAAVTLSLVTLPACDAEYSQGDRVGVITKFSDKGTLNKSWEGELSMEGFKKVGSGEKATLSNVFEFSVDDPAVVPQVQKALEAGGKVRLHYRQIMWNTGCSYESDYRAMSVTTEGPAAAAAAAPDGGK